MNRGCFIRSPPMSICHLSSAHDTIFFISRVLASSLPRSYVDIVPHCIDGNELNGCPVELYSMHFAGLVSETGKGNHLSLDI